MISAAIIHQPRNEDRAANVQQLTEAIPHARVVLDDGTGIKTMRKIRTGCWPIAKRAWVSFDPIATHHLVLEDDAVLCESFLEHLETISNIASDACVSLFRGARDCSVGTLMPTFMIGPWLTWATTAAHGERWLPHHDFMISRGMFELGFTRLYSLPSIVEHGTMASTLDHGHVRAFRFEHRPGSVSVES
jgi:hypothetical protein